MVDHLTSHRLQGIGEYYFSQKLREIEKLKKNGKNIINLGIGSPDLAPPQSVKKALIDGLEDAQFHRYQSYKGIPELRTAFTNWYQNHYAVSLNPDTEVLPLIGSKEGIIHVCMAFLNDGDHALIPNPGYPTYAAAIKLAGGTPIPYSLTEQNNYLPDFGQLEQSDLSKVKMMWINYPHMPTGTEAQGKNFNEIRAFCQKNEIILINDNPYSFILTDEPKSILKDRESEELVLELNSLSKSHNMAGWRVGVLAGNQHLIEKALVFKSNMDSGMFKPIMQAAVAALNLDPSWYDSINEVYQKRKELVHEIADLLGCEYSKKQVGMFVWAKIPVGEENGETFADQLLDQYEFFVPPGKIFGDEGNQYIRFSLCSNEEILNEVIRRIK